MGLPTQVSDVTDILGLSYVRGSRAMRSPHIVASLWQLVSAVVVLLWPTRREIQPSPAITFRKGRTGMIRALSCKPREFRISP
jgi:hypothetical protein